MKIFPILVVLAFASPIFALTCSAGVNSKCKSCTVDDGVNCNQCQAGHKLVAAPGSNIGPSTNTCQLCAANTGRAADTTDQTDPASSTCGVAPCSGNCNVCGATAGSCVTCKAGYYLSAVGVCTMCSNGRGKDEDTAAGAPKTVMTDACTYTCPPEANCVACKGGDSPGVCIACAAGRYLETTGTNKDKCVACAAGCTECTGPALTQCQKCAENFYYSATNTCTACAPGTTKPASSAVETTPGTCIDPKNPTDGSGNTQTNTSKFASCLMTIAGTASLSSTLFSI